ncbi:MAG: dTDP-4-dehydrorhamnose reductase [Acidobacteria bacterium]|nr:dTDP-4-dehydrorhamnose reductase [Acidobacteriota bacterium]MBI3656998.1 dTDP-4-dehydrorhamnose reductase [Acidobacteriota bacterium]
MRIAVTGATGMLGHDLVESLSPRHTVIGFSSADFDITDIDKTLAMVADARPDLLIHSAANANVDGCELNPEPAYQVNSLGTRNVALACAKIQAAMVYISTDYVFNGQKSGPYVEWDTPNPLNIYGRSKWWGEQLVTGLLTRFYIVRSSWLYGKNGGNFVDAIRRAAQSGRNPLRVVQDQVGSPTLTSDLAEKLAEVIEKERYGTYHITNSGHCSWFEFAQRIVELAGMTVDIQPIKSYEYPTPTARPSNSVLRNYVLELERIALLRPWHEALAQFIRS